MKKLNTPYKKNVVVKTIKKNHSMSKIKTYHIKFPYVYERSKSDENMKLNKIMKMKLKKIDILFKKKLF